MLSAATRCTTSAPRRSPILYRPLLLLGSHLSRWSARTGLIPASVRFPRRPSLPPIPLISSRPRPVQVCRSATPIRPIRRTGSMLATAALASAGASRPLTPAISASPARSAASYRPRLTHLARWTCRRSCRSTWSMLLTRVNPAPIPPRPSESGRMRLCRSTTGARTSTSASRTSPRPPIPAATLPMTNMCWTATPRLMEPRSYRPMAEVDPSSSTSRIRRMGQPPTAARYRPHC